MHTLAAYMVASTNTAEDEQHTTQKDYQVNFFFKCQQIFWCHVISYHFQGTPLVLLFQQCCLRLACTEENISYESFSDVGESRVWFASKNLTPCRMH